MNETESAYKQVSGVDIEEQKRIWDERGKGYYGEYLVFNHLYGEIPGMSKILMNCEVPADNGKTTEIDLILMHETGIYSFEMKHYKGDIYGSIDGKKWTQYFRTQANEVFHNPIRQNAYHISALKKMLSDVPVFSFVVFTNDDCRLRIDKTVRDAYPFEGGVLCMLSCLPECFKEFASQKETVCSAERINDVFIKLSPYSKLEKISVRKDGEIVPLLDYFSQFNQAFKDKVKQTKEDYALRKEQLEKEAAETQRNYRRKGAINGIITIATVAACIACVTLIPQKRIEAAERRAAEEIAAIEARYEEFFRKFDDANQIVQEDVVTSDLVEVSGFTTRKAIGVEDGVAVSFTLTGIDGDYALGLSAETRMIVRFTNGDVKECDFYYDHLGEPGCILRSNAYLYRISSDGIGTVPFDKVIISGLQGREIESIKLNNIVVYVQPYGNKPILDDVEIEIYRVA